MLAKFLPDQDEMENFCRGPHMLFVPTNKSFGPVVSEENIFIFSANQKQELPTVAMFFVVVSRQM